MIADDEAGAVAVREQNEAPLFGQLPQEAALLRVVEDAEALRFQNDRVHHLAQRVFIVAPLHHDGLPDTQLLHLSAPPPA